jgi:hypothetical protein
MKLNQQEQTMAQAATKAKMCENTARKYLHSGKLPSQSKPERHWRTRQDPFRIYGSGCAACLNSIRPGSQKCV